MQKVTYYSVFREMTTVSDSQAAYHFEVHKYYHFFPIKLKISENVLLQSIRDYFNYCGGWRLMPHCISHPTPDSNTPLHDECTFVITCMS